MATKKQPRTTETNKGAVTIKLTPAQKKAIKEKLDVDASEVELKEGDFKLKKKGLVNPFD